MKQTDTSSQQIVSATAKSHGKTVKSITIGFLIYVILDNFVNQTTMIILAIYIPSNFSSSPVIFSLTGMLYNLGKLLLMIPLAKLSTKIGKRKTLLLSFTFTLGAILIMFLGTSLWLILLGRFMMGCNTFAGITFALIDDFYPENTRGKPVSWFSSSLLGGFLLGSLIAGNIHAWLGDKNSFLLLFGITIISWINIYINIKDRPQKSQSTLQEEGKIESQSALRKKLFTNRAFVGSLLSNFSLNIVFLGAGVYWSFMIINYYQISPTLAGLFFLPPLIGDIGAFIFTGTRKNLHKVMQVTTIASLLSLSLIAVLPFWNSIAMFTIYGVVFGFINCSMIQATDTISLSVIPLELKNEALGIYKFVTVASGILGPLLFGLLSEYIWVLAPFLLFPLASIVSGGIYKYMIQPSIKNQGQIHPLSP